MTRCAAARAPRGGAAPVVQRDKLRLVQRRMVHGRHGLHLEAVGLDVVEHQLAHAPLAGDAACARRAALALPRIGWAGRCGACRGRPRACSLRGRADPDSACAQHAPTPKRPHRSEVNGRRNPMLETADSLGAPPAAAGRCAVGHGYILDPLVCLGCAACASHVREPGRAATSPPHEIASVARPGAPAMATASPSRCSPSSSVPYVFTYSGSSMKVVPSAGWNLCGYGLAPAARAACGPAAPPQHRLQPRRVHAGGARARSPPPSSPSRRDADNLFTHMPAVRIACTRPRCPTPQELPPRSPQPAHASCTVSAPR